MYILIQFTIKLIIIIFNKILNYILIDSIENYIYVFIFNKGMNVEHFKCLHMSPELFNHKT